LRLLLPSHKTCATEFGDSAGEDDSCCDHCLSTADRVLSSAEEEAMAVSKPSSQGSENRLEVDERNVIGVILRDLLEDQHRIKEEMC
jgi:hypothetical protein